MSHKALLFCADEKTARVVTQVLTELDFVVEPCSEPFAAVKKLMATQFDAVVVDCDNEQNATLLFKSARNSGSNQGSLAVAVVEGQAGVAKAFRIGANLVLTKPINIEQSKGTLRVARGLLKKAEAGKPVSTPSTLPGGEQTSRLGAGTLDQTRAIAAPLASPQNPAAAAAFSTFKTPANSPVPASLAAGSSFEVDHDATPHPEPAEAAFLESIPDPLANKPAARAPEILGNSSKSPWQPLSSPIAETKQITPGQNPELGAVSTSRRPFGVGSSGQSAGAATAPAKAREVAAPAVKIAKGAGATSISTPNNPPEVATSTVEVSKVEIRDDVPKFATSGRESKTSKIPFIAALVVIAMAAAGYYGWSKMHIGSSPSIAHDQTVAAPAPSSQVTPAVTDPPQADTEITLESPSTPDQSPAATMPSAQKQPISTQLQSPTRLNLARAPELSPTAIPSNAKPTPGKTSALPISARPSDGEAAPSPTKNTSEGVTVKASPVVVEESPAVVEEAIAPPPLQAAPGASDKTIAGLIANSSPPMSKPVPQLLKVSQGITEGMLLKKVNPIYPTQAVQMRRQGTVLVSANITKSGSISSTKLIKGDPILARAALAAVKQWRYKPYFLNGQPIEVETQISVSFKLP